MLSSYSLEAVPKSKKKDQPQEEELPNTFTIELWGEFPLKYTFESKLFEIEETKKTN